MKVEHHEWTIDSLPKKVGFHWHSWCEVERKPIEDGADGCQAMTIIDEPANEVVIRPNEGAGWRVEFPDASRPGRKFVTIVVHEQEALNLAAQLCPKAQVKIFHEPGKR